MPWWRRGRGQRGSRVDRPLAQLGLRRNVVVRIPFFVSTIFAVAGSDLVLTVTYRLAKIAAAIADVRTMEAPAEIEGFSYLLAWHPRLDAEPARAWSREQLREVATEFRYPLSSAEPIA